MYLALKSISEIGLLRKFFVVSVNPPRLLRTVVALYVVLYILETVSGGLEESMFTLVVIVGTGLCGVGVKTF